MTVTTLSTRRSRTRRPMSGWRLEWLRLLRSARGVSLLAVYVFYGLLGPVIARYLADIVRNVQSDSGIKITITRAPVPKDGMINFVSQVGQIGLIVTVVVAAGALAFDGRRGISTFFRTRARDIWQLVLPRAVVPALGAVVAYTAGTLAAWYETSLLIGAPSVGAVLAGWLTGVVFLVFVVAVVAAASSLARGTLGTIGVALGALVVFPLVGIVDSVHDWLPTSLMTAPVDLLNGAHLTHYLPTLALTICLSCLLVAGAVVRLNHRDA